MMIRLGICWFALLICFQAIYAQQLKLSPEFKISNKVEKAQILGKTSAGIVIRKTGGAEILELYSKELNFKSSKHIESNERTPIRVDIINDKVVYFFIKVEDSIAYLSASIYEPNLNLNTAFKQITSFKMNPGETAKNFKINACQGGLYTAIIKTKEELQQVSEAQVAVVDFNLELDYTKTILFTTEPDLKTGIKKTLIDINGQVFLVLDKKSNKVESEEYRDFQIVKCEKENEPLIKSFALEKELFDIPKIVYDQKNKNIVITALFDDNRVGEPGSTGILLYKIKASDLTLLTKRHQAYKKSFLAKLTNKDESQVQDKLMTFRIKDIVLTEAGDPIVFAESYFQTYEVIRLQSSYFANSNMVENRTINIFNYNDIIGFHFNASGEVEKEYILRKKQTTEDDGGAYSSYIIANNGNKMYFLHTEGVGYNVDFLVQGINDDGSAERKVVLADMDKNAPMLLKMGKQISLTEVIIPCFRSNTFRLAKFSF